MRPQRPEWRRHRSADFLLFSLLLLALATCIPCTLAQQQRFAIEAEDVTAVLGTDVTLPCRVVHQTGVLQWTKDDFGLGPLRDLSAFDRYTMIGEDADGDYALRIESVQLDDDARYQCQVSPGPDGQPGIRSRFVRLTVLAPAQKPRITQGDFMLVTEQNEVEVECISVGGKPPAELTWIDGNGNGITAGVRYTTEPMATDPNRFAAKSVLRLRVKKQHHNTTLLCQSQNAADRHFKTAEVHMEVKYAPKLRLIVAAAPTAPKELRKNDTDDNDSDDDDNDDNDTEEENDSGADSLEANIKAATVTNGNVAVEGHEARFICMADANPGDITYKWFVNNELVVGDYTTEMVIHNVNRSHHLATVKCSATNAIGTAETTLQLHVRYPPVFRQPLRSVEADARDKIKLHCDVDGNPLEIVWVHDPVDLTHQPRVVGSNATLALTVSDKTAGRYYCKASVPGYAPVKAEAVVFVKRAPRIESPRQQFGARGDTIRVRCAAFSVPKARHVSWSYAGREILAQQQDDDFAVEEDQTARGVASTLVIRRSEEWHFGRYNCTVVNDYGVDVLQIELVQQNNFQFLMIVVGATSGVVVLVVLVLLVLCIKLRGKRDMRSDKEKQFSADMIPEKHDGCWSNAGTTNTTSGGSGISTSGGSGSSMGKELNCNSSGGGDGASSHSSDYKPIKAGSSESDYSIASTNIADSTLDYKAMRRNGGVPLAEPIELPLSYRHSIDYADSYYPPKYAPPSHSNTSITQQPTGPVAHPNGSMNNSYVTRTDYARYCAPQQQHQQQQQQQQQLQSTAYVLPLYQSQHQLASMQMPQMPVAMAMPLRSQPPPQHEHGLPGARSSLIV